MSEGKDRVIVHIESIVKHLTSSTQWKPTIFKVDDHLRQVNEKDFEPEILAIGPLHHGKDHVKGMEQHKVRYLQELLQRRDKLTLEKCVTKLRELEDKARQCYAKPLQLDEDEFVEMLLLDGCFVIELLRKYWFEDLRDKNDLIFQFDQTLSQLRHDLMLFENQLPFFALNQLFNITKMEDPDDNMRYLILLFVDDMFPWIEDSKLDPKSDISLHDDHLLGLVYQSCFPFSFKVFIQHKSQKENNIIHINSALELKEAGIRLKGSKGITLMDVKFVDGIIRLPQLNVSDRTESLLRNLIAYEHRLSNDHPKYVTDYVYFMHCLINSTKDIEIMRYYGIITNLLGGDEMVYDLFNEIGKNVLISSNFCYCGVFDKVNRHCSLRHKKWMAKLRRNYFNSPWSSVSFLAAVVLLLLTFIQTLFSVISYKKS